MTPPPTQSGRIALLLLLGLSLAVVAAFGFGLVGGTAQDELPISLSQPLSPGPLRISVLETGELESLEAVTLLSPVEGTATIDYIIPEGTVLTQTDVEQGTIVVRLNTSEVLEKKDRSHREWTDVQASLANGQANLEIQLHQNQSDLRTRRLEVRFSTMDVERYVGKALGEALMGFELPLVRSGDGPSSENLSPDEALRREVSSLLASEDLGGEALQRMRELDTEIQLAEEELRRAETKFKHSERLEGKGYVSREDLEADGLALKRRTIERERAVTARVQYVQYDFVKEVARLYSEHVKAKDELLRTERNAESSELKARSEVKVRADQEAIARQRYERFVAMEGACVIKAPSAGLVVYGTTGQERSYRGRERIERNAQVRERQELLRIPQPGDLGARVSVHESRVESVKAGQRAWITVGARTDRRIAGKVRSVASMADSQSSWWNPDLKVYTCQISFDDPQPDLKPGMSAQVEIVVDELADVLSVPLQAVGGTRGQPAVWVWNEGEREGQRRDVVLGPANDYVVQILSGVEASERVLLAPPQLAPSARRAEEAPPGGPPGGAPRKSKPNGESSTHSGGSKRK